MNTETHKIDQLQKEVVKLEVKMEHLEKQHSDFKLDVSNFKKEIDTRFDDFENMLKVQFQSVNTSLKGIEDIIIEGKGAKKAVTIILSIVTGAGAFVAYVYNFIK